MQGGHIRGDDLLNECLKCQMEEARVYRRTVPPLKAVRRRIEVSQQVRSKQVLITPDAKTEQGRSPTLLGPPRTKGL